MWQKKQASKNTHGHKKNRWQGRDVTHKAGNPSYLTFTENACGLLLGGSGLALAIALQIDLFLAMRTPQLSSMLSKVSLAAPNIFFLPYLFWGEAALKFLPCLTIFWETGWARLHLFLVTGTQSWPQTPVRTWVFLIRLIPRSLRVRLLGWRVLSGRRWSVHLWILLLFSCFQFARSWEKKEK